jgi:peroxiredoxin (alkyl hydroperoxide reductase subunit C)
MLGVGDKFPEFNLKATADKPLDEINIDNVFVDINNKTYEGKWLVVFFYPKDFTFVCPTEIAAFGELTEDFADRDTQLLGGSVDSEFVHWAWRKHQDELKDLPFPLLADVKRELSGDLGIIDEAEGVSKRATFIVDPDGIIRFVMVTDLSVGRNPKEVLRVLDALQTDELCPCNWSKGDETIDLNKATA